MLVGFCGGDSGGKKFCTNSCARARAYILIYACVRELGASVREMGAFCRVLTELGKGGIIKGLCRALVEFVGRLHLRDRQLFAR